MIERKPVWFVRFHFGSGDRAEIYMHDSREGAIRFADEMHSGCRCEIYKSQLFEVIPYEGDGDE